jgi:hypothetical protein
VFDDQPWLDMAKSNVLIDFSGPEEYFKADNDTNDN